MGLTINTGTDLGDVETGGFALLDEARYLFQATDAEMKPAPSSDKHPSLNIKFRVIGAPESELEHFEGVGFNEFFSLAPTALWKLKGWIEAADPEADLTGTEFEIDEFIGKNFVGTVQHREWDGKTYNSIARFEPESNWVSRHEEPADVAEPTPQAATSARPSARPSGNDEIEM